MLLARIVTRTIWSCKVFRPTDGSVRLTYRPFNNVILVSRYEYQHSIINTTPDSISGLGEAQSSTMNSQIIAQNVTWTPLARLMSAGRI